MRNLRNIHRSLLQSPLALELTAVALDIASDDVICAIGPSQENSLIELKRWKKGERTLQPIASWDAPCPLPSLDCDEILDLQYFSDSSTACLVLAGGDLIVVRESPQAGEEKIEIVGSVDAGISAAAWSPDEELLAITTNAATLLYMTREFENVTDITLHTDDLNASNHVSVGWGKKETQFKGKKARALRDPTMPETVDEGVLSEHDRKETTISWRGDGTFLAVNSIETDSRRVIRVYSREGVLDSVSEPVDGLIGALSWRPAGNLIAGIQYLDSLAQVVFFEKNGLRHGQFDLRLSKEEIMSWGSSLSLKWNIDSSVLAVCFNDRVQLWSMSNYHYYLKQEILVASKELMGKPATVKWHSEKPLKLILSSKDGVQRLVYSLSISGGPTAGPDDYGVVAVIDGKCLKLTPMRLSNVPPPMALHDVSLKNNIIDVAITMNHQSTRSIQIAVLHHGGCSLYEWPLTSMIHSPPSHKWSVDPNKKNEYQDLAFSQAAFSAGSSSAMSILVLANYSEASMLWIIAQDGVSLRELSSCGKVIKGIITNGPYSKTGTYVVTDDDAIIAQNDLDKDVAKIDQQSDLRLLIAPFTIARTEAISCSPATHMPSNGNSISEDIIFSLADNGSLMANQRRLARNCTSFLVTPAHLIYTTSQHILKFVHMAGFVEELEIPPDTPESDERCRSIERGAKLVTVMPSTFALVMQMPRGNLETIYPRALVLVGIRTNINKKKYKKAFLACRNHRVDMNILHDHEPQQFISHVGAFVDQVQKVEHIDLFLSQLREEDVSKTMYKDTNQYPNLTEPKIHQTADASTSKVNRICDAFLNNLNNRTSTHFQNVVTAHVCKVPPDLDAGLSQIAGLRSKSPELVDAAIEHICFLADVNRLYDNALGLYDLELALLVAQQSQKDPKEYLPFLRNLQKEPPLRRQYSIDNHLGRHQKALKHLCELKAFEEVKSYAVKHTLYSNAMEFYRYQEDKLKELMRLYGDYLHQQGKFKEAGIAYEYLTDYPSASESYRRAHLWKETLACATLIPLPQPQLHSLCQTLSDTLIESKNFSAAATIHLDYLSDIPTATRLLCKGYFFADALRIIGLHSLPDLLTSIIDVGLVDGMATMTELLADCKSQLNAQVPRIRELRLKKAQDPLAVFDGDINDGADIPDNVSLAPTDASTTGGGSLFTRYTNRTGTVGTNATRKSSKSRRREERKKARGKKGSIYEEEYLVNSVGRLIERVNSVNEEVERLVVGLMRRGMRERAGAVEGSMVEVVGLCRGCLAEVFGEQTEKGGGGEVKGEEDRTNGGEGWVWDTLEGEKKRDVPVVKDLARLSLLA